jgi:hypothetical protein
MVEGVESRRYRRGMSSGQKVVVVVTLVFTIGLLVVILGSFGMKRSEIVSPFLRISASDLILDAKSGKVIWSGAVTNTGTQTTTAPWVRVTIYDPDGDSVDNGEATTATTTISAGQTISFTAIFNTRGTNLRSRTVLEMPNARSLGM